MATLSLYERRSEVRVLDELMGGIGDTTGLAAPRLPA
jgi:hypothetical protein